MMIETSYMKFGKGPNGIIGKKTKPRTLQIWAKSQHSCSEVLQSLDAIRENQECTMITHMEEKEGRMKADLTDKVKLQNFLETCLHPFDCSNHPESALCNILTGQLSGTKVNVNKSVEIGTKQMGFIPEIIARGFSIDNKEGSCYNERNRQVWSKEQNSRCIQDRDDFLKSHVFVVCWSYPDGGSFQV